MLIWSGSHSSGTGVSFGSLTGRILGAGGASRLVIGVKVCVFPFQSRPSRPVSPSLFLATLSHRGPLGFFASW